MFFRSPTFSAKDSLYWLDICWLLMIISLILQLILIVDSIDSPLSMLTHRNELLIWVSVVIKILRNN